MWRERVLGPGAAGALSYEWVVAVQRMNGRRFRLIGIEITAVRPRSPGNPTGPRGRPANRAVRGQPGLSALQRLSGLCIYSSISSGRFGQLYASFSVCRRSERALNRRRFQGSFVDLLIAEYTRIRGETPDLAFFCSPLKQWRSQLGGIYETSPPPEKKSWQRHCPPQASLSLNL